MNSKIYGLWVLCLIALVLCLFTGCQTPSVPITYTEPARLNMSGIKRIAIESNNDQVTTTASQRITATGLYALGTAAEISEWRTWSSLVVRQRQAEEITANNLLNAYAENTARADSNYGNKTLRITGIINEIDILRNFYYVRITGQGNDSVMVFFASSEIDKVRTLDKDQEITFVGECYGRSAPDDDDIAEILRLLGAGNRVIVINANFLVEDNFTGALDAIMIFNTTSQVYNDVIPDGGTERYQGSDGEWYTRKIPLYKRSASVNINYQVWNTRSITVMGKGERTARSREYSTTQDRSSLPEPNYIITNTLNEPLFEVIGEIVPTQRTLNVTLAKESENKDAKKEMSEAEKLVKVKDYEGAVTAYGIVYDKYKNFAAGYNQAVLTEATADTETALVLMEALFKATNNPMAQTALNDLQRRNVANQAAESQLSQ